MESKKTTTPKSIRIGAIEYDIKHTDDLRDGDVELMGCIRYIESRIHLRSGMDSQMTKIVLLHEILHGILSNAGIAKQSEKVIDAIAYGLADLERNNPGVFKINLGRYLK